MKDNDLEIHAWPQRPSPGGQLVGTYGQGVLLIHRPTGIAVVQISERSQHANRVRALARLQYLLDAVEDD